MVAITHPDDRTKLSEHLSLVKDQQGKHEELEFRIITRNGEVRWMAHECQPVFRSNGDYLGSRGSNRDVTDRRILSEQINASLAEKATLLREIHHRVKNNLQIVSSMLNMQIRKISDPKMIETLRDSQNRVMSMALVHEHLYRGKDFCPYRLKELHHCAGKRAFPDILRNKFRRPARY